MGGVYGDINSRADFDALLEKATKDGKSLLAKRTGDPTIEVIVRQLEAVARWSANERIPTKAERKLIDMGVRASREFEGGTYNWTQDIYALDAYMEDWPSDEKAASATDDDFFDEGMMRTTKHSSGRPRNPTRSATPHPVPTGRAAQLGARHLAIASTT